MNLGTLDVQNVNRKSFSPTLTYAHLHYILLDYSAVCYWCLAFGALTDESDLPRSATAITTSQNFRSTGSRCGGCTIR
jgi:hypothetical protein